MTGEEMIRAMADGIARHLLLEWATTNSGPAVWVYSENGTCYQEVPALKVKP